MDSYPIPESDSLLSQVQAGIDLQQDGLSAVLQGIGAGAAEGLALQANGNKKCVNRLRKQINDQLKQQNDRLIGVIDQLLSTLTTLIGEQSVALAQVQGSIGVQFPFAPLQGQQHAIPTYPNTGTVQPGGASPQQLPVSQGGLPPTMRPLEGPLPVLPNLLPGNLTSLRPTFPSLGTISPQNAQSQPTKQAGNTAPSQGLPATQTNGQQQSGQQQQLQSVVGNMSSTIQQGIASILSSISLTVDNAPVEILQTIVDLAKMAGTTVLAQGTQPALLPGQPTNDALQPAPMCIVPCNTGDTLLINKTAEFIDAGIYVNGDEEIQPEYEGIELP